MTNAADHLLFLLLAAGLPAFAGVCKRGLERRLAQDAGRTRLTSYTETIILEWALVTAVLALWIVADRSASSLGLAVSADRRFIGTMTVTAVAIGVLLGQIRAARSLTGDTAARLRSQLHVVERLMPHTAGERAVFFGVAVTAGFCEELLYRGFMMAYLVQWIGWVPAGIASAIVFGVGHAHYQDAAGVMKTTVVGLIMAALYLCSGSLWPPIALHVAIDVQGGAIGYAALARTAAPAHEPADVQ